MRRDLVTIAGATAVAAVVVVATQTGMGDRPPPDAGAAVETAAPPAEVAQDAPPPTPDPTPGLEAEIARLTGELDRRETELAVLQATLARLEATLAQRDAALAAGETELASLRADLDGLRERYAFEIRLAAMKQDAMEAGDGADEAAAQLPALVVPAALPQAVRDEPMTAIHFETGSARLTPGGQAHAAAAAVMLAEMPLERVRINGYADRTGSPAHNQALAEARARAVADFLAANGVPADTIEVAGMIEPDRLPVATDAGVSEPLNRSATITPVPVPTG